LRTEVAASRYRLEELDRQMETDIQNVREAGRAEAERIIADARRDVARLRSGAPGEGGDVG
jgi:F0F1-type ATP synthase membrane subunit b/b'